MPQIRSAFASFARLPFNSLLFRLRSALRWSRGRPTLRDESKHDLFAYLGAEAATAEARERELRDRYRLDPLRSASTRARYRKNLWLLDVLDRHGPALDGAGPLRALDVGAQDWHYVFALERWLRYSGGSPGRSVALRGLEVDGYGVYPDLHSRRDYALAHAAQTGNAETLYQVGDFLGYAENGFDLMSFFYPFVTRKALLAWGLPLRFHAPERFPIQAAALLKPRGWLLVLHQTGEEAEIFSRLAADAGLEMRAQGPAASPLVDFQEAIADRRYSLWRKSHQ